ncbi:MAG: serine/threonine-protein kinase [Dokdonella sp.]|uniref:serine/threonine-protein kinase n=1 Tax=Dokdonella sp. TaxID=2291710 RepID=UPI0025B7EC54|nr:serine/threonine-protein kinase [Dokdonella sp.]MBZ0223005.1 serine/threonine-protein kinase [Dokdonella sp.]
MSAADDERYRHAQAIVHGLLDAAATARATQIAAACGDDAALRAEVQWLLAAAETNSGDVAGAADPLARIGDRARALLGSGRVEASAPHQYRLIERIGDGGMGQVWLAERDDGAVRQRVALKLLRGGSAASVGDLARFSAEGRILAGLNHPNITHLLDAGGGADGEPYLAMELVEGERLDRWCDAHAPGLRERIDVFLKICAAVEYAHARLVIHRDLKPANILVTREGEPKLLDFGIARLLEREPGSQATTVLNAMTLAYASPEQVRGDALGTATDIYSLGVVLYELLTGVRPFDHLRAGHERANAIVSGAVTPPSRSLRSAEMQPAAARTARTLPARRISADLDAIVLKAMRREPEQRYASVAEFADDLRNFLAARPVLARRGQWGYRARRFLWRNRWPLAAASLLLIAGAGFTWRTVLAEREARQQAASAERATQFLTSIFAASDANINHDLRDDLSAREVLAAGTARIEKELAAEPRIRARLLESVANAWRHMNENTRAASLMREAADLNLSAAVDDPLAAARCLEALANLLANGEFPAREAEAAAQRSLELAQRLTPAGSQAIANAWMVFSLAQNRAGNYTAALASAQRTEKMNLALREQADNRLPPAYNNLCIIHGNRGEWREADRACTQALDLQARDGFTETIGAAMPMSRQANVRAHLGDPAGAIAATEHALRISRAQQGERGAFTALFELRHAAFLDDQGDYAGAGALLDHVLETQAMLDGKDSGEYAAVQVEMARRQLLLGQFDTALPLLRELLARANARYGADDPRTLQRQALLGQGLLDAGQADAQARTALEAAEQGWAGKDFADPPAALAVAASLAQWFAEHGDAASAQSRLARVRAAAARTDAWTRLRADLAEVSLARQRGDQAAARDALRVAWDRLREEVGSSHPQAARIGLRYAQALREAGHVQEAAALTASLQAIVERAFPPDSAFRHALPTSTIQGAGASPR